MQRGAARVALAQKYNARSIVEPYTVDGSIIPVATLAGGAT
jgi:hypothetical protein